VPLSRRSLLLGGGSALLLAACRPSEGPAPIVGRHAPDFTGALLPTGQQKLSDLAGRPVVLNFFATWCIPCRQELPTFEQLAARHADKGLTFLLVDMAEDPDDVALFLDELRVTLPTVVDHTGEIVKTYRVRALPSTFFIGRDGNIKMAQLGALDENLLSLGISKIV
jgi:cytochrome c biogenesis protein CcmG/thiol:disulfide interchange protein DsbE